MSQKGESSRAAPALPEIDTSTSTIRRRAPPRPTNMISADRQAQITGAIQKLYVKDGLTIDGVLDALAVALANSGTSPNRDYHEDIAEVCDNEGNVIANLKVRSITKALINSDVSIRQFARTMLAQRAYDIARDSRFSYEMAVKFGIPDDVGHVAFDFADGVRSSLTTKERRAVATLRRLALGDQDRDDGFVQGYRPA